ncbi:hypothetical protein IQ255_22090 [Pleurocapsales cyanobacterium LEGE 10410]|nr:hypothetical protein [Pleurocapsales cyanobacterium LEGE 10410]
MTTSLQNQSRRIFSIFSTNILPLMGYGLLLVTLINIGTSIAPLQLTNPLGKFQTGGEIIERTPFVLLGMVLIYYGQGDRSLVKNAILKTLSWLSLALAILLLSIIPLNIINSWHYQQQIIHSDRLVSHEDTIQQFQQQLIAAKSETEIGTVLQQQVAEIDLADLSNIQQLKDHILSDLSSDRNALTNSRASGKNQQSNLFKKCLAWNLGALVAATLFLIFWQSTTWEKSE